MRSSGFGWEITNVANNGADLYAPFSVPTTIRGIDLDISFMTTGAPTGWAEVLANVAISAAKPNFGPAPPAYYLGPTPGQDIFGPAVKYNPAGRNIGGGLNGPGFLTSLILKCYCHAGGSDVRHATVMGLAIPVVAGNCLVLHMDHAGQPGDVEMQGVLFYD